MTYESSSLLPYSRSAIYRSNGAREGWLNLVPLDWAAECTGYAHEVAEMALAHAISNQVERAYRRGDLIEKRRRLTDDWAAYCSSGAAAATNVTPIRKSKLGESD